jgi:hypothetical protein
MTNVKAFLTILGIFLILASGIVGFGTLQSEIAVVKKNLVQTRHINAKENKATNLEMSQAIVKLNLRVDENDIRWVTEEIEKLRGWVGQLDEKVSGLNIPSTTEIETDVVILKAQIENLERQFEDNIY